MKEYLKFNKEFKKFLPVFLIILAVVLLLGTSYALLRSSDQGENTYVMNVGLLEVTFVDSETNELSISNAVPMTDSEGMSQSDELIFTVKNTGDFKAQYNVYIEETSTNPAFKTVIRFISNKNDTGYNSPKTLSEDKYIDTGGVLDVEETATYKVKLWLSETADNTYMNKTFTARIVIEVFQVNTLSDKILSSINSSPDQVSVVEDGITYISGTADNIDFNYVWYSGKLWRITAIYPDGTMKMITDDNITTISYGSDVNFYTDERNSSYIYQWLNEDFLDTLYNYEKIIVTDANWNATDSNEPNASTKLPETTMVTAPVGLLNSYEYYKSYQNTTSNNGYLNNGYFWWLLNPSSSRVWSVDNSGTAKNNNYPLGNAYGVRPSINLQSGITINGGTGTSDDPYTISGDKGTVTANTTFLNTRQSGEYVNFDGELYRIVGIENNTTKLNKMDYVRDESDTVIEKNFSSSTTFGSGNSDTYWDYYLNNTWYNSINETYKNMLVAGTYYLGTTSNNYKGAICATASNTVTTANCAKTTSIWTGYVGLPRYGEMFASQQGSGYSTSEDMWLITPYSSSFVWFVYFSGGARYISPSSSANGARPSINLSSTVKITRGTGLKNDPFEISL